MSMYVTQFIVCVLGTVGFSFLFNAPEIELPYIGLGGGLCWLVYLFITVNLGWNNIFATLIATIFTTIFCRGMAVARACPVTVYLLTGLFPLVPGGGIYHTAFYMFTRKTALCLSSGLNALEIAVAIAFGISIGFGIPQEAFRWCWYITHKRN